MNTCLQNSDVCQCSPRLSTLGRPPRSSWARPDIFPKRGVNAEAQRMLAGRTSFRGGNLDESPRDGVDVVLSVSQHHHDAAWILEAQGHGGVSEDGACVSER